jgi:hypothetical protein
MYTPRAMMRHVHCGTSIEWSPSFMFHTYRNRLAMLLKNAPMGMVCREWTKYVASCSMIGLKVMAQRVLGVNAPHLASTLRLRALALRSLVLASPELYRKRRHIQRTRRVDPAEILGWMRSPQ